MCIECDKRNGTNFYEDKDITTTENGESENLEHEEPAIEGDPLPQPKEYTDDTLDSTG